MDEFDAEVAAAALETLQIRNGDKIFPPPLYVRDNKDRSAWHWFNLKLQAEIALAACLTEASSLHKADIIQIVEDVLRDNAANAIDAFNNPQANACAVDRIIKFVGKYLRHDNGESFIKQSTERFAQLFENEMRISAGRG